MPTTLTPIPSGSSVGGKSRAKLIELTRFYIQQYDESWISDTNGSRFDIGDALDLALKKWYEETKCGVGTYTLAATIGTSTYARSSFPTGANRLFEIYFVSFNGTKLIPTNANKLNSFNENWRTAANGTPLYWMPWGDTEIRLYPTPDATSNIIIEGYISPDLTLFDSDTDEPPGINAIDHESLAYYAAFLAIFAEQSESGVAKQSWLYQEWDKRLTKAKNRVSGSGNVRKRLASRLDKTEYGWDHNETITIA